MQEHMVVMSINGIEVPSSCVKTGTLKSCEQSAKRLNRRPEKHPSISWFVRPCVSV